MDFWCGFGVGTNLSPLESMCSCALVSGKLERFKTLVWSISVFSSRFFLALGLRSRRVVSFLRACGGSCITVVFVLLSWKGGSEVGLWW